MTWLKDQRRRCVTVLSTPIHATCLSCLILEHICKVLVSCALSPLFYRDIYVEGSCAGLHHARVFFWAPMDILWIDGINYRQRFKIGVVVHCVVGTYTYDQDGARAPTVRFIISEYRLRLASSSRFNGCKHVTLFTWMDQKSGSGGFFSSLRPDTFNGIMSIPRSIRKDRTVVVLISTP